MTEITEAQFQRSGLSGDGKYPYGTEYGQACSWQTAAAFCNFLSPDERERCYRAVEDGSLGYVDFGKQRYEPAGADHITKTGFRLPTECEWEFVCRGMIGTNKGARYCFGSDPQLLSDYASIHGYRLQVASKKPNCFGLFDIHGGLAEWCDDNARPYHANLGARPFEDVGVSIEHQQANGKMRILRGGDFFGSESSVAVQRRSSEMQFSRPSVRWGLRVACTIPGFPKANDLNVGRVK